MSNKKRRNSIRRSDYHRVLVTETLPFETPLIFSNDGLYDRLIGISTANNVEELLIRALIFGENEGKTNYTIPYLYKIRKNSTEFRRLALLHPRSQWKVKEFYEKYENLILYHCTHSPASIRAPHKIAGSFFVKNAVENLNQYKNGSVSLLSLDELTKHSPSFFSYRGYDRLYKFFESRDYFELEKHYVHLRTLDVSKCFDSIYTHSMSWALKDKEFTKKNVDVKATFSQEFDKLMCHTNHSETNGIVIGPEVSRVFAEIIFQEIDILTIRRLQDKSNLLFGNQYCFRRYVDDVFIFAETSEIAKLVYESYADVLMSYNLHTNVAKSVQLTRPFVTNKSRLIHAASIEVNSFIDKFLEPNEESRLLKPTRIHSVWRLTRSFIVSIKTLCSYNLVNYDEVAPYLIAVITERVKKLVAVQEITSPDVDCKNYRDAILVFLDVLYFLYEVSPSVGASYKLCTSVILVIRFTKKHLSIYESTVAQRIYELTEALLVKASNMTSAVDGFLPLETLNVILAVRELGEFYLMPKQAISKLFRDGCEYSYFSIVSCLFYVRDEECYADIRADTIEAADKKLHDLSDIRMHSEKAYLLLDLLSCPYVPEKNKKSWVKEAFKRLGNGQPETSDLEAFLISALTKPVHVNWKEVDLLCSLEKKELKQAY